jgi:hypothetical protein
MNRAGKLDNSTRCTVASALMAKTATMPNEPDPVGNAPSSTGMLTPQTPEGDLASAKLDAFHAMKLLDRGIEKFGVQSKQGKVMLSARAKLTEEFGEHEEEVQEFSLAELKRMLATLQGPGEPPKPQPQGQQQQPQAA